MSDWVLRFFQMASLVGSWSKDPRTQVGAVIVDGKRIVSMGYNGAPSGLGDHPDILRNKERKLARTIHAEQNAILFSKVDLRGKSIFVTLPPCPHCTAMIIQSGLKSVAALRPHQFVETDDYRETRAMLNEVGIPYTEFHFHPDDLSRLRVDHPETGVQS